MTNNSSNTGLKVALGILIALFLGTGFYTSKLYNDKKENEAQLTKEKQMVMNDLSAMAAQYDTAISENEVTNANLIEARERIEGLMDSLKTSQANVSTLWRYKQKYFNLQKEMDVLLTQNDSLRVENSLLATTLDSTQVQLAERNVFTDSLLIQNTELATVVEDASVLSTVGLKGFGVIERSSGKLIPTERASRSDKIRVCFTVAKNNLVEAGDQELYVQVIDPKNNVIGVNEQIQFEDKTLNYSVVSKFNYEQRNLNVCEFVGSNGKNGFEKGRYVVNVFNKKDLVSTSEFTLK
ncbi:MAG: chromosome partitioning protein ParA [Bacteroidia bacterium]|nr:chromosome partitioning protein ParA [Bacteroidia bacterium]